jgi:hypothetical protein
MNNVGYVSPFDNYITLKGDFVNVLTIKKPRDMPSVFNYA